MANGLVMLFCFTLKFYRVVPFNVYVIPPVSAGFVILIVIVTTPQVIIVSDVRKDDSNVQV